MVESCSVALARSSPELPDLCLGMLLGGGADSSGRTREGGRKSAGELSYSGVGKGGSSDVGGGGGSVGGLGGAGSEAVGIVGAGPEGAANAGASFDEWLVHGVTAVWDRRGVWAAARAARRSRERFSAKAPLGRKSPWARSIFADGIRMAWAERTSKARAATSGSETSSPRAELSSWARTWAAEARSMSAVKVGAERHGKYGAFFVVGLGPENPDFRTAE